MRNITKVLLLTFLIAGCNNSYTTEELSKEVVKSIEQQFKGHNITIKEFTLTKKTGNEYIGVLTTKEPNGEFNYKVSVIYDGNSFTWEIVSH